VTQSGAESRFYRSNPASTLSAICKSMYGSANQAQRILEEQTDADASRKMYPGQVLIIPANIHSAATQQWQEFAFSNKPPGVPVI
jgi:hypothetical protein